MLRPLPTICFIIALLTAFIYLTYTPHTSYRSLSTYLVGMASIVNSHPDWSSKYSGYLDRAAPHPNPHDYAFQRELLSLVALRNAPVEHNGFSLALFSDRVAIDKQGHMSILAQTDYDGIVDLVKETNSLPTTGEFRNQWRVEHQITSRPIDRILAPKAPLPASPAQDYEDEYIETSVYGFDKTKVRLETPVNGYEDLPASLWQLTGLVQEARAASGGADEVVLQRVKGIIGNVF